MKSTLVDMPAAAAPAPASARQTGPLQRPSTRARGRYSLGMLAALGVHAAIIFGWPEPKVRMEMPEFSVESAESSVEVSLVAALPAEEVAPAVEPPPGTPPPVEPPPPPEPVPVPEPPVVETPEKPPEMAIPEPKPTPVPRVAPKPKPKQQPQKPAPPKPVPARASGDGSSAIPGNDATTARASSGALGAKPGYLRNPEPTYPEDARAAGHEGTVMLYVKVDAAGKVLSVRVSGSSGHASLDERARSTVASRWSFKPAKAGGVPVAADIIIPIRFTLNKR